MVRISSVWKNSILGYLENDCVIISKQVDELSSNLQPRMEQLKICYCVNCKKHMLNGMVFQVLSS